MKNPTYEQVSAGRPATPRRSRWSTTPRGSATSSSSTSSGTTWTRPTRGGQFCDHGRQYRTAIFYHDEAQKRAAEASKRALEASEQLPRPIVTEIVPLEAFYPAEEYHQDYHKKNPVRYKTTAGAAGAIGASQELWGRTPGTWPGRRVAAARAARRPPGKGGEAVKDGTLTSKPTKDELKKKLTPLQYEVTQEERDRAAFHNEYWDNHEAGIYVDVVSGEPLFSSLDKFDSGTGWPSFTKPLEKANVTEKTDALARHGAHRGALEARRLAPRPRLRRRPDADGPALLHQLGVAALHPRGQAGGGGLRPVHVAVREK